MLRKHQKQKLRLAKNTIFLGLLKKYKTHTVIIQPTTPRLNRNQIMFNSFTKYYTPLMQIGYIFEYISFTQDSWFTNTQTYNMLHYYTTTNSYIDTTFINSPKEWLHNNMLIFSRPQKQLFLMMYKSKPTFIFTGGLMRIVMNEKRKSSKKLYKVAISLIKLATILLTKRRYFTNGFLKLINVGQLRTKIIQTLYKSKCFSKIIYILIQFKHDFTSQKFETRRAIKKYVKKRFKLQ